MTLQLYYNYYAMLQNLAQTCKMVTQSFEWLEQHVDLSRNQTNTNCELAGFELTLMWP